MQKKIRRRFLYILILVFLGVAPLLVAYSLGYTLNISRHSISQTGGIFIKSRTPRLAIFLNSQFMKETSLFSGGALLSSIEPGTYLLRIEKAGYTPWTKTVTVEPAMITELRNIILSPNPIPIATSTPQEMALIQSSGLEITQATSSIFFLDKKKALIERTSTTTNVIAINVHSFSQFGDELFFIDGNGFLSRKKLSSETIEVLGHPGFFLENKKSFLFLKSPLGEVAMLDPSGGLFVVNDENAVKTVTGSVKKISFESQGEKLLIIKEREVLIRWMQDNRYQPFQKKGTMESLLSVPSDIFDAMWLYQSDSHAVLTAREGIFLTETDGRGGRNTIELVTGKTDELFTTPERPSNIFFKRGKTWFTIEF